MTDHQLDQLERDVEAARARLLGDVERLRSPGYVAEAQHQVRSEASERKNLLVEKAKQAARDQADGVVANIQARIAANPAAALAIAAGLGWRLYRHPPVATVLVGAGLMSLLRTDPEHPGVGAGAAAPAAQLAGTDKDRVQDWRGGDDAGRYERSGASTAERAADFAETTRERLGEARHAAANALRRAGRTADEWSAAAGETARHSLRGAARAADRWTDDGRRAVSRAMPAVRARDGILLGTAAVALAAAVGIAAQRRAAEDRLAAPAVLPSRPNTQAGRRRRAEPER